MVMYPPSSKIIKSKGYSLGIHIYMVVRKMEGMFASKLLIIIAFIHRRNSG